jgi:hypothetical protein
VFISFELYQQNTIPQHPHARRLARSARRVGEVGEVLGHVLAPRDLGFAVKSGRDRLVEDAGREIRPRGRRVVPVAGEQGPPSRLVSRAHELKRGADGRDRYIIDPGVA